MPLTVEERLEKLEQTKTLSARFLKITKEILFGAAIAGVVAAAIIYYSTKTELERATAKVAELNGKLAVCEDHLSQFELQEEKTATELAKTSDLAKRLGAVKTDHLQQTLAAVEQPQFRDLVMAADITSWLEANTNDITTLAEEVATLYGDAYLARLAKNDTSGLAILDGAEWEMNEESIYEQLKSGQVPAAWNGSSHLAEILGKEGPFRRIMELDKAIAQRKASQATK